MVLEAQAQAQAQGEEAHPVASEASERRFRGGSEAGLVQHSANTRTAEVADCWLSVTPPVGRLVPKSGETNRKE